jgi:hypothetical protein
VLEVPGVPKVPRVPKVPGVPGVPGVPRVPGVRPRTKASRVQEYPAYVMRRSVGRDAGVLNTADLRSMPT